VGVRVVLLPPSRVDFSFYVFSENHATGILVVAILRQQQHPDRVLEAWLGDSGRFRSTQEAKFFWGGGKLSTLSSTVVIAYRCRNPLTGTPLRVNILDRVGIDDGGMLRRHLVGTSLWNPAFS
jgi:hypothetical protein